MTLLTKDKDIAVPGEVLAQGMDYIPADGAYRQGDDVIALRLGLVSIDGRAIKLIPLSGRYMPKDGDVIIAKVIDVLMSGWRVELNSAYSAMLPVKESGTGYIEKNEDLTKYYDVGDYIVCKIINVTSQKLIDITMRDHGLKKLSEGRIMLVPPNKVPRIIGKQGSMVGIIKQATNCTITVGQNGVIWMKGTTPEGELLAVQTIEKIIREAHKQGLTDEISKFLQVK
jgi:exosome complex component RRP4